MESAAAASAPASSRGRLRRVGETCLWLIVIGFVVVEGLQLASTLLVALLGIVARGLLAGVVGSIIAMPLLAAASGIFGYLRERQAPA